MAGVFLSYARDDADRAGLLATALEKAGHTVWWDLRVRGGAQFSKVIEEALKAADAVVVLWSSKSVESAWVRDEAAVGRDSGRLVPVTIDEADPPLGFRQYQTIDMSAWSGRGQSRQLTILLDAVDALTRDDEGQGQTTPAWVPISAQKPPPRRGSTILVSAVACIALIVVLIAIKPWWPWSDAESATVIVRAADRNAASEALARDVLIKLGTGEGGGADAVKVNDGSTQRSADLIIELSGRGSSAGVVLLNGKDRQVLFSQDLAAPPETKADLNTSVAIAAKSAITCGTDALAARPALRFLDLKQYLRACERFNSLYGIEDVSLIISQLDQIVGRYPRFTPAWKRLLLASAFMRTISTDLPKPSSEWLRRKSQAAALADDDMPELVIAQMELLPVTEFHQRFARIDPVLRSSPDSMYLLGARAEELMAVGRLNDAVVDAERASRLYPLSSYARSEYVRALAFSGRSSRAFEELRVFQPLPDLAMGLTDTRFRVNMRYGDPKLALKILDAYGTSKAHEAYLAARIQPTSDNVARAVELAGAAAKARRSFGTFIQVLQIFGRSEEAFETLLALPRETVDQSTLQTLFRPTTKGLRNDRRFIRVAQRFGLLGYWNSSGRWPDFCFEPGLAYDCKKEALKLT